MAEIQAKRGILLKYRSIQTLQLTGIQFRVLESITPVKIEDASLLDLVKAFKILKNSELGMKGDLIKLKVSWATCWKSKMQKKITQVKRIITHDRHRHYTPVFLQACCLLLEPQHRTAEFPGQKGKSLLLVRWQS